MLMFKSDRYDSFLPFSLPKKVIQVLHGLTCNADRLKLNLNRVMTLIPKGSMIRDIVFNQNVFQKSQSL